MKLIIPRFLLEKVASKSLAKEKMSEEDEAYLRLYFQEDISKLETLIEKDLSEWK